MVNMGQYEKGLYSKPTQNFTFYLINELSGEIVATYEKRPSLHKIESKYPNFWDHYKLIKKPSEVTQ
tara:strand:- start:105 stop:305 length:201 start_codon:yes stop_codon:yes gene_type:complete